MTFGRTFFSALAALSLSACDKAPAPALPAPPPTPSPKTAEEIWRDVSPSLVYIKAQGLDGSAMQGSGFIVELDGKRLLLTNRHVVKGAEKVFAGTDTEALVPTLGYRINTDLDLAVIDCPKGLNAPALKLASTSPNPGAEVTALGFPLGISKVITRGIISSVEDQYVLFDAPISSGNSGGPLVNQFGEVVAVATMGSNNRGRTVVQNLNVGIRVSAIPRLSLFTDPLLRISAVAERVREVEAFIEKGYETDDWFGLVLLLAENWIRANDPASNVTDPHKAEQFKERMKTVRQRFGAEPLKLREAVERYTGFLKECERQIEMLPAAFMGLGNDPAMASFLKEAPKGGWFASSDAPQHATPEQLPELARISASHWVARIEDHRFRLEWALRFSPDIPQPPSVKDLEDVQKSLETKSERPSIRLPLKITGDRSDDLKTFFQTMLEWKSRMDVIRDLGESLSPRTKIDPIRAEIMRGDFLFQVSNFRQRLATVAAEQGELDKAVALLRSDLERRAASARSGSLLGEFLALSGRFEEAWAAYDKHYSGAGWFDAFEVKRKPLVSEGNDLALNDLVKQGFSVDGLRTHGFANHPAVLENARRWNDQAALVDGRRFTELATLNEVVSSDWFRKAPRLSRIRTLYYFRSTRPWDEELAFAQKAGDFPKRDYAKERAAFENALSISSDVRKLWEEITSSEGIGFPL